MQKGFFKGISIFLILPFILMSCEGTNKQAIGTGAGVLVGGLIGSQFGSGSGKFAAMAVGAGLGAMIGGSIGAKLDEKDKRLMVAASQAALEKAPTGQSVPWTNPDSGHRGSIVPTKTYQNQQNQYCREYVQEVMVGGETQKAYGTACRMPDGHWKIIQTK